MNFVSAVFPLFFAAVFAAYWILNALPRRVTTQNILLLAASYYFYGSWDWRFLGLLLLTTTVDFLVGVFLDRLRGDRARATLLALSLSANLLVLGFFKYFNFFMDNILLLGVLPIDAEDWHLNIILPIGITFYTFQSMAYTIDVFRRRTKAETNALTFYTYVAFFPQLVAGPIERAGHMLPQFRAPRVFSAQDFRSGLREILLGVFKKLVIADNLAPYVNAVFADVGAQSSTTIALAAMTFGMQIYMDFSAYSNIARGTARMLGIELMVNFDAPYGARSLSDFWRRWHISLSTWFRDYVYFPLGGSRLGAWKTYRNLMIVFLISGLWHGASWTFVIWGGVHGAYLVAERMFASAAPSERTPPWWVSWFSAIWIYVLVTFAWIFFRADGAGSALQAIFVLFTGGFAAPPAAIQGLLNTALAALLLGFAVNQVELRTRHAATPMDCLPASAPLRWTIYFALSAAILLFGVREETDFVYFQF